MKTRIAGLTAVLWLGACIPAGAAEQVSVRGGASLSFSSPYHDGTVSLTVAGRGYSFSEESTTGDIPSLSVADGMADGLYGYEVRWSSSEGERTPQRVQTGSFIVRGGLISVAPSGAAAEI